MYVVRLEMNEIVLKLGMSIRLLAATVHLCEFVFVRKLMEFRWAYERKEIRRGWSALIPLGFSLLVLFISLLL